MDRDESIIKDDDGTLYNEDILLLSGHSYHVVPFEDLELKEYIVVPQPPPLEGSLEGVWKGKFKLDGSQMELCIKVLKPHVGGVNDDDDMFNNELETLSKISHPNVVRILCASLEPRCIVFELMKRRDVGYLLADCSDYYYTRAETLASNSFLLHFSRFLEMARCAAIGIAHLHQRRNLIHANLKVSNILVQLDWSAKVSKFTYAAFKERVLNINMASNKKNRFYHLPPETMNGGRLTESVDSYSFAMILWEMLTRRKPFDGLSEGLIWSLVAERGDRPCIPTSCPKILRNLIAACWNKDPALRPSFYAKDSAPAEKTIPELLGEVIDMLNKDGRPVVWMHEGDVRSGRIKDQNGNVGYWNFPDYD